MFAGEDFTSPPPPQERTLIPYLEVYLSAPVPYFARKQNPKYEVIKSFSSLRVRICIFRRVDKSLVHHTSFSGAPRRAFQQPVYNKCKVSWLRVLARPLQAVHNGFLSETLSCALS